MLKLESLVISAPPFRQNIRSAFGYVQLMEKDSPSVTFVSTGISVNCAEAATTAKERWRGRECVCRERKRIIIKCCRERERERIYLERQNMLPRSVYAITMPFWGQAVC